MFNNNTNKCGLRYCFVIPVYRHGSTLMTVVNAIKKYNLPIIVIDDGNDEINKRYIKKVIDTHHCTLVVMNHNSGKGAAMKEGILCAHKLGFTHIFQVDSDGQHDLNRVGAFLEESRQNPKAVIVGYGAYDKSAPKHRVNGRKIANTWVHIVTMSRKIKDSMIGFRVYPVEASYLIEKKSRIDKRMGFDIDLLVHLSWLGVPVINKQVKIKYPLDGVSNFRNVRDNIRISVVYTKLCVTMMIKWPFFVGRKLLHTIKENIKDKNDKDQMITFGAEAKGASF